VHLARATGEKGKATVDGDTVGSLENDVYRKGETFDVSVLRNPANRG